MGTCAFICNTGKYFYSVILSVVLVLYTELYPGAVSLKVVMTKQFQQEGHANRILSSVVTPCSPVNVYQHFKGTWWSSNLPWWRRQKVEYSGSSLHNCRITKRFVSEVKNVVTNCTSYWRVFDMLCCKQCTNTSAQSDVPARLQFEDILFHVSDLGAGVAKSIQWLGYRQDDPGFEFWYGQVIFLLSRTSRPSVGAGIFSRGKTAEAWR